VILNMKKKFRIGEEETRGVNKGFRLGFTKFPSQGTVLFK
jgi:hypothetical protein